MVMVMIMKKFEDMKILKYQNIKMDRERKTKKMMHVASSKQEASNVKRVVQQTN